MKLGGGGGGASSARGALTPRALAVGLCVGTVLCFSNAYFGLQTGWVTMGSLQAAILGYFAASAKVAGRPRLTAAENVIIQTTAVATATMPLAAGLVGIIPALGMLTPEDNPSGPVTLSPAQLLAWCTAMAFFGVFAAVPLRRQTIVRERLRFPSGAATASVIRTLHGEPEPAGDRSGGGGSSSAEAGGSDRGGSAPDLEVAVGADDEEAERSLLPGGGGGGGSAAKREQWARALRILLWTFAASFTYSLVALFWSTIKVLPVFDWVGLPAATAWGWVLQPSPGYIGQGMIMGPRTAWSMMAGAVTGWAVLGPRVRARGWAPGPLMDVETGVAGWLMWLGLALLLGDCFSELGLLLARTAWQSAQRRGWAGAGGRPEAAQGRPACSRQGSQVELSSPAGSSAGSSAAVAAAAAAAPAEAYGERLSWPGAGWDGAGPGLGGGGGGGELELAAEAAAGRGGGGGGGGEDSWLLTPRFWVPGLALSTALATGILSPLMGMPVYEPLAAVLVALLVALLAVRALGQTDLNPVSGVGKVSQLVFAWISPGAVVPNLVAGAIAEAGAQQAGDLMQDFKTAYLLGVSPADQLVAMLLGSAASVPLSVGAYLLYTSAWQVPGPVLPAPTAQIWLNMAKLVNGGAMPPHIAPYAGAAAALAAALPLLQHALQRWQRPPARKDSGGAGGAGWQPTAPGGAARAAALRLAAAWRARSAADWALVLLPSGVGFAVGMYLSPTWTLPRLLGSVAEQSWLLLSPASHAAFHMVTASGLVLGEGSAAVVGALWRALAAAG